MTLVQLVKQQSGRLWLPEVTIEDWPSTELRVIYWDDAHHLEHWADGGCTSLDNLALLCRRHHVLAHHSPWTVSLDPTTRRPVWTPPPPRGRPPDYTYVYTGAVPPPVTVAS